MNAPLDAVLGRRDVWRGPRHADAPVLASGHAGLDALLPGGGWPLGALLEFCRAHDGLGTLAWLMPALVQSQTGERWVAFVAPPYPLYAPALAQAGLAPQRCLVVSPPPATHKSGALRSAPGPWAAEQLLRGGACAGVLLWWDGDDANALRRLQLAAELGGAFCVLLRPEAAMARVSPAALRAWVRPGPALTLFKCRGTHWHAGRPVEVRLMADSAATAPVPDQHGPCGDAVLQPVRLAPGPDAATGGREPVPGDWRRLARRERERRS
jgi:hypothetical protein